MILYRQNIRSFPLIFRHLSQALKQTSWEYLYPNFEWYRATGIIEDRWHFRFRSDINYEPVQNHFILYMNLAKNLQKETSAFSDLLKEANARHRNCQAIYYHKFNIIRVISVCKCPNRSEIIFPAVRDLVDHFIQMVNDRDLRKAVRLAKGSLNGIDYRRWNEG